MQRKNSRLPLGFNSLNLNIALTDYATFTADLPVGSPGQNNAIGRLLLKHGRPVKTDNALVVNTTFGGSLAERASAGRQASPAQPAPVRPTVVQPMELSRPAKPKPTEPSSESGYTGSRASSAASEHASLRRRRTQLLASEGEFITLPGPMPPAEKITVQCSPSIPGVPIVYRSHEDRSCNPDKLNLDRRGLSVCPILEGEEQLRLLNLQHNCIEKMEHLTSVRRLIFLDLYDNRIADIAGISALKSLRVLMLGKNRIKRIENLEALTKLDVLDLHNNEIETIENVSCLTELRVLNLTNNRLTTVQGLAGLNSLAELNLKRNRIRVVHDVDRLPNLQRLFLSHNQIDRFEDIACCADSPSLQELSLDGNPIALDINYRPWLISYVKQLKLLDLRRVLDEERRLAQVMVRKDEDKLRQTARLQAMKERRKLVVARVQNNFEMSLRGQSATIDWSDSAVSSQPGANHKCDGSVLQTLLVEGGRDYLAQSPISDAGIGQQSGSTRASSAASVRSSQAALDGARSASAFLQPMPRPWTVDTKRESSVLGKPRDVEPSDAPTNEPSTLSALELPLATLPDALAASDTHLVDFKGDTLSLYGIDSLPTLDKNWNPHTASQVQTIEFTFAEFAVIATYFHKLRAKFPNLNCLRFNAVNLRHLAQLNALANVRKFEHLNITENGNSVTKLFFWREYIVWRLLPQTRLKTINDAAVDHLTITRGETMFSVLGECTVNMVLPSVLVLMGGECKQRYLKMVLPHSTADSAMDGPEHGAVSHSQARAIVSRIGLSYDNVIEAPSQQAERLAFCRNLLSGAQTLSDRRTRALQRFDVLWPDVLRQLFANHVAEILAGGLRSYEQQSLARFCKANDD